MGEPLFHLALPQDWAQAQARGTYETSTRGRSLAQVGFIHLSSERQWRGVRAAFYADVASELLLLEIDPAEVGAEIILEVGNPETGELFPHLYGPLPVSAVRAVTPIAAPHG